MTSILQFQIKNRLAEKNLSVSALEKRAGLGTNSVRKILMGASKDPGIRVLRSVANILGCSVSELLGEKQEPYSPLASFHHQKKSYPWDLTLYLQACKIVDSLIKRNELDLPAQRVTEIIWEVYTFSFSKTPPAIDMSFCEWLFDKN
ncbi:MAG: helix-turn-helix transcriptional regulator [Proteobacteria bacterium]|nr:helix-turn-helix transcriptional regulator [Pseudomonadota bacterium]